MVCPYERLIESVTRKFDQQINRCCEKLFSLLQLNHFWYFELANSGDFFTFGSNAGWHEYLSKEKFVLHHYYFRDPAFFQTHITFFQPEDAILSPFLRVGQQKFHLENSLQILEKTALGIEAFGVTTSIPDISYLNHLLREASLLKLFIRFFKRENRGLFSFLKDNQINLKNLLGPIFYQKPYPTSENLQKAAFLKGLGINQENFPLTLREKEILQFVTKGYSASQIAASIHLSKRTVEHHIERIKNKLSCDSKQQLMGKGRELELLPLT